MSSRNENAAKMVVEPYLFFGGRCDEALEFYRSALGATVIRVMRFNESPNPIPPGMLQPGFENKVMHSSFRIGETTIMASDGTRKGATFGGFSLSLTVPTTAEADRVFALLAEGGLVTMPPDKTFWSPWFGMVTDRFGVGWMVIVPKAAS